METIKIPPYEPGKFVDREEELDIIESKVAALERGQPVAQRTVVFTGERGTGKSWLLSEVEHRLRSQGNVYVLRVDLGPYRAWGDPALAAMDILRRSSQATGGPEKGLGQTVSEISQRVMEHIGQLTKPFVLLVDQVHESDWDFLRVLEDYVLGPLAANPQVLLVLAGRGRPYPWRTPELRLFAEFHDLEPFGEEDTTKKQLERQKKEASHRARRIHQLSGGNPLVNWLLALCEDEKEALRVAVAGLLQPVPWEERSKVQEYIEALCVLRSFDELRIPNMLSAYYGDDSYLKWSYRESRTVRDALRQWFYARWEPQKGYVIDEPTRNIVENYLLVSREERWRVLHCAALRVYEKWLKIYPDGEATWQDELAYHRTRLESQRISPGDCPEGPSVIVRSVGYTVSPRSAVIVETQNAIIEGG